MNSREIGERSKVEEIYNRIILILYNYYFILFKIDDVQSFSYQVMIILMHIHKLRRLGLYTEVSYAGRSEIIFSKLEWEKVISLIDNMVSLSHKRILEQVPIEDRNDYILSLLDVNEATTSQNFEEFETDIDNIKNKYYVFLVKRIEATDTNIEQSYCKFIMKSEGFSYQYNGYKKSEVRLQEKANLFALLAAGWAIFIWLTASDNPFVKIDTLLKLTFLLVIYLCLFFIYFLRRKKIYWHIFIIFIFTIFLFIIWE